jgi:hypothetical protein
VGHPLAHKKSGGNACWSCITNVFHSSRP